MEMGIDSLEPRPRGTSDGAAAEAGGSAVSSRWTRNRRIHVPEEKKSRRRIFLYRATCCSCPAW
jgi:hypothetical protein